MDSTGIRIRLATILAGIGIAVIAGLIISVVANYFFNLSVFLQSGEKIMML